MRILITGGAGQLGKAVIRKILTKKHDFDIKILLTFGTEAEWNSLYRELSDTGLYDGRTDMQVLDITDPYSVRTVVAPFLPDVIINCAAYTAVDSCEDEEGYRLAELVNVKGPENLAKIAKELDAKLIHISTDYVFNGESAVPYKEDDVTDPVNAYGRTKALGEEAVRKTHKKHFIIRTAWLYGDGKNFVRTMLRLSETNKTLKVVSDQTGSPTSAAELAGLIVYLMDTEKYGTWHGVCEGDTTWYEFTEEIMKISGKDIEILPIKSSEYKTAAKRPRYSVLLNNRLHTETDYKMKTWKDALKEYLE